MSNHITRLRLLTPCLLVLAGAVASPSVACAQCGCSSTTGYHAFAPGMTYPMGIPGQIIEGDSIHLVVNVPEKAILKINGDPTISVGPTRYFVVKNLDPERTYKFKIVAETANAAGVPMEETKTVKLQPGNTETVSLKPTKRKQIPAKEEAGADAAEATSAAAGESTGADVAGGGGGAQGG